MQTAVGVRGECCQSLSFVLIIVTAFPKVNLDIGCNIIMCTKDVLVKGNWLYYRVCSSL